MVHNRRGWDIPGGHLENEETPVQAFQREVLEETNATLGHMIEIARLVNPNDNSGIVVFKAVCSDGEYHSLNSIPDEMIDEVDVISIEEMPNRYYDKNSPTFCALIKIVDSLEV